ncbi:MAG TPA: Spy/CpxP family protein refolding chaperone [Thermoanaerobaculia bacterium]|nr:Spy/CpxP family protein refolding chaperone [Thermoanaerobaculia bacterium]
MKRTVMFLLILLTAVVAFAAPQHGRTILPPPAMAEFLSLNEQQSDQMKSLRETLQSTVEPLREQIRANRDALEAALAAGDSAKAGEIATANYAIRNQIKAAADSFQTSFAALLTPEQKAKWSVYQEIAQLRGRRPERGEGRRR